MNLLMIKIAIETVLCQAASTCEYLEYL